MNGSLSKKQLREAYGISGKTLRAWLMRIPGLEINKKRIFVPIEVEKIFTHLGNPFSA